MSDILQKILATKRREVAEAKERVSQTELEARARDAGPLRDFIGAIHAKHAAGLPAVIAEIKKASPSAGIFRAEADGRFDPAEFARSYEQHGAACLSVLTDRDYFQGSAEDLVAARAACSLPVLRKDFIVDPYQIIEARAMGADAVLFIMGVVPVAVFQQWEQLAVSLGLAVLAESHSADELEQALCLETSLIGINNRDLTRFVTDVNVTLALQKMVPSDKVIVTESGIATAEIASRMIAAGVSTFLIGGALMQETNPGQKLASLFPAGLQICG